MSGLHSSFRGAVIAVCAFIAIRANAADLTVEELKAKLASSNVGDRPHICIQIAQQQLSETDKFYAATDVEKAEAALTDVVAFSELARDYAVQSHKYQKQSEIAVRVMTRKLTDIEHALSHEDGVVVRRAIDRLQRVRDDLLVAMFPKGSK
jgi:hypothetical protein